jgi:hypothetical protein
MKLFAAENLVTLSVTDAVLPWDFKATEELTLQIRNVKEDRQNWYKTAATKHHFYTGLEGLNHNQRVSKENPPLYIHAFVADYDLKIPEERVNEAIKGMDIKPAWVERSLGGNVRLVWLLPRPYLIGDYAFCASLLDEAMAWLRLELLPGLDVGAFTAPTRLYCNGCEWRETGHGPIKAEAMQAFLVRCSKSYRFKPANDDQNIPLDVVEAELKKRYPSFNWPTDFTPETQGPSFWIPESVSPQSAILKSGGMISFAAHATKLFYSWSDILGADFTKQFATNAIAKATEDIWWDSKRFWRKINGVYTSLDKSELMIYFKVACKLGAKPDSSGLSPQDLALDHIYNHQRITSAVPFVFRPPGLTMFQGERKLNTYSGTPVQPAEGMQTWGPQGNFPFISALLDGLFSPPEQLPHFLASFKHYYASAFFQVPAPGQNTFLMGGAGTGKTLLNREIVGVSVGGYADASDFLVDGSQFNSHLMRIPHWCLDDDAPSTSPHAQTRMNAVLKKVVANQQFFSNQKFEVAGMVEWMGRIGITTNLDFVSSRIVGPMDNSSLDKTNIFRVAAESEFKFPCRTEIAKILNRERAYFLRWLLDWEPPDTVLRDARFGFKSYQETTLLDQTHQSSNIAPFKEVLLEALSVWFGEHGEESFWCGTVTQLVRLIMSNPFNDFVLRSMRLEQTNRYLEHIQREGLIRCTVETGASKTRVWRFYRPESVAEVPETQQPPASTGDFAK